MISNDITMSESKRTALLIRCSAEEANLIRAAAKKDGRTLSGYVLRCLQRRLELEAGLDIKFARLRNSLKH